MNEQSPFDETAHLPPHSTAGEQGVLGCVLLDSTCLESCENLDPSAFFELRHRTLFEELRAMNAARQPLDLLAVQQRLRDSGNLEAVGGLQYLSGLLDSVPSAANLDYYLGIVREKFSLRKILTFTTEMAAKVREGNAEPESLLSELESRALGIRDHNSATFIEGRAAGDLFLADGQAQLERAGRLAGITYGLSDLNSLTGGIHAGELVIVGARPSIGKTAFGTSLAISASIEAETPARTLFVTLESSTRALVRRIGCALAGVSIAGFRDGCFRERDLPRLASAAKRIQTAPIAFEDHVSDGLTASRFRALVRRHVRQSGVRLVILDYLQKLKPDSRHEKRTYEVAAVSEALKAAAEENNVAVLALAQLNRDAEDDSRIPSLRDLADSGQIERDADTVILLHRKRSEKEGKATLVVAKQRDGETGVVASRYVGSFCRFLPEPQNHTPSIEGLADHP